MLQYTTWVWCDDGVGGDGVGVDGGVDGGGGGGGGSGAVNDGIIDRGHNSWWWVAGASQEARWERRNEMR